jgi:hypothetical protein
MCPLFVTFFTFLKLFSLTLCSRKHVYLHVYTFVEFCPHLFEMQTFMAYVVAYRECMYIDLV